MYRNGGAPAVAVEIRDGSPRSHSPRAGSPLPGGTGRKRRAVARGVQSTLSKTSMLANFLPTGTLLAFEMLLPAASGNGSCSAVSVVMLRALLALCGASCFIFHFTDSFRAPDGKVYYGFVTPKGLSLFRTGLGVEVPREDRYRFGFIDVLHAVMSVVVFAAIALSDYRVSGASFPAIARRWMRSWRASRSWSGRCAVASSWCSPTRATASVAWLREIPEPSSKHR